jgi:ATP-dependent RNA helicase DeaD
MEENMTFSDLGLSPEILQALEQKGYGYPTTVQAEAIPPFLQWKDVIAKAPTGTGKTYAFGIPMIEHIDAESEDLQGLILAPTRELAIQICEELRSLLEFYKDIRVTVRLRRGQYRHAAEAAAEASADRRRDAGPAHGRYKRKALQFDKIQTVVLDEADRMLDMGFIDDVDASSQAQKARRSRLFSATISQEVMTVSWMYQRDEVEITVLPQAEDRPDITQYSISVPALEKIGTTIRLLHTMGFERSIIFCNTKVMCQRLCDDLRRAGVDADCIHGDIRQVTREKTMRTFKDGKLSVLIATDVASRGIDVDDVDCVINYDLPHEPEYLYPPHRPHGPRGQEGHGHLDPRHLPREGKARRDREIFPLPDPARQVPGGRHARGRGGQKAPAAPPLPVSPAERGFLLLCCPLGDAQARPLSASAFRALSRRVRAAPCRRSRSAS